MNILFSKESLILPMRMCYTSTKLRILRSRGFDPSNLLNELYFLKDKFIPKYTLENINKNTLQLNFLQVAKVDNKLQTKTW